ncbi:ATPase, F1/V1/A1 complex, alpha/beta subunit [Tanacetum coccineum]
MGDCVVNENVWNISGMNKEREEETGLGDKSIKNNVGLVGSYDKDDETSESNNVSYANMVKKDEVPKNLNYIPTMLSMDGISALASSLGKPMMMDTMTANMCYKGVGNLEYARNLVKMDTEKELKKEIEIQYRDHNNNIKGSKKVKVVYDWKPPACTTCKVFGHDGTRNDAGKALATHNYTHNQRHNKGDVNWREPEFRGHEYRKRQVDVAGTKKSKDDNHVMKNKWNVKDKEVDELIRTANKYYVLKFLPKDNDQELRMLKEKMIVDKFLDKKVQPILIESIYWLKDMIRYLKEKWEKDRPLEMNVESEEAEVEDVINISSGYVKGKPWSIARDMNVTLYPNEHTYGTSVMNVDMMEFQDSLNEIERRHMDSGRPLIT